ncbi:MAG: hypothetical protein IIY32_10050, partial [Thermoguttaceae bacterium]|nr:hypothetical protein [Thermoguttaceae bacterium]
RKRTPSVPRRALLSAPWRRAGSKRERQARRRAKRARGRSGEENAPLSILRANPSRLVFPAVSFGPARYEKTAPIGERPQARNGRLSEPKNDAINK